MASLGELFIQLGVVGDTKELEKTQKRLSDVAKKADEVVKAVQGEIDQNDKLAKVTAQITKATQKYNNAKTEEEKTAAAAALNTAKEQKQRLEDLKTKKAEAKTAHEALEINQKEIAAHKEKAKALAGVVKGVAGVITAVTGALYAINRLTDSLISNNQAWMNFTRQTDISLEAFQKWGSIGAIMDKSLGMEGAAGALEQLNEKLFELRLTGEGARGFQLAGINPIGQDAEGVLEQLRDRIQGMNNTAATYLLKQMGLDPRLLPMLRLTREEFESLNKEMANYRLTPEQRATIQELNTQLSIVQQKIKYLKDRAILAILPAFTKFMQSLARVTEGIAKIVNWIIKAETPVSKLTKLVLGLASAVGVLKLALIALAAHPIIAGITLLLSTLYLLIDDIMVFQQGGDSVIGHLLNSLESLQDEFQDAFKIGGMLEVGELSLKKITAGLLNVPGINLLNPLGFVRNASNMIDSVVQTPGMHQNSVNNRTNNNYDQRQLSMTNTIYTNQPAQNIEQELNYARTVFV